MIASKSAAFANVATDELVAALQTGLAAHFEFVSVEAVDCPDLKSIGVATSGMCGATALVEFGGEPYAHNPKYRGTNTSVSEMLNACGIDDAKVFGAAMADTAAINGNAGEMISNVGDKNLSRVARVSADRQCISEPYLADTCGPIANLFVSEGAPGEVLCIEVRRRIGDQISLTQAMRESLAALTGGERHIGMGGVFEILGGQIRSHIMPNYDCLVDGYYDVSKEQVVKDFLQFYEHMGPGLLFFAALWTGDPTGGDLNLRVSGEHTHFYHPDKSVQQAGHYHGDVTPGDVHYRGYFKLADRIIRFGDIYEELGIKP
ncbi:MAG: DUF1907 domain-containing protein [Woeseiaceae bacterium]